MEDIFASLYEWFGLIPFYSTDMGDHLRGWDITCTDYIGKHWYILIGWVMFAITAISYSLQYHVIDSSRCNKKQHWWLFALLIVSLNFLVAFSIPFNSIQADDFCNQLNLSVSDCIGFGISNSLWSFILFVLMTSFRYPRDLARNCRHTTFWKP